MPTGPTSQRPAGAAIKYPGTRFVYQENEVATKFTHLTTAAVEVKYHEAAGANSVAYDTTFVKKYKLKTTRNLNAVPYSFHGTLNGEMLVDRDSKIYKSVGGDLTETPEIVGTIDYGTRQITITDDAFTSAAENLALEVTHMAGLPPKDPVYSMTFRTPGAPIRPGSLQIKATMSDGSVVTGAANNDGDIDTGEMKGFVNANTGYGWVEFGAWVTDDVSAQAQDWYNGDNVEGGEAWQPYAVQWESVLINCVVTTYLPLDENLLGLNPVRLPIDGKVPIFRDGDILLIHSTDSLSMPSPLSAGQSVSMGRGNLSLIELYDQTGAYVDDIHYTTDLVAGTVTMANPLDLSGYTEPLVAMHRIEDMVLAADVQITGHIGIVSQLTHDYVAADSYISSVLGIGDLQSRVYNEFEQKTWYGDWLDGLVGDAPTASYDFINYPISVTNKNSIEERFAIIFEGTQLVKVVGEHLGVILQTSITGDIAPINPNTGEAYFVISAAGWGSGWAAGNVVRFNMNAANYPLWFIRTTLQGPATEPEDQYTVQLRGDSN